MSGHFDFTPHVDGIPVDPVTDGGTVGQMVLNSLIDDYPTVAYTLPTPTRVQEGLYRYPLPAGLVESRYWPEVTWTPAAGDPTQVDALPPVDLPSWQVTGRVVSPWPVAVRLGVPQPLTGMQQARILSQISESQAKVEDYLNRPVLPELRAFTHQQPVTGYDLLDAQAWPGVRQDADDTITVAAATLVGYSYTVDAWVGLNAASDPRLTAIREWVVADAAAQLAGMPGVARLGERVVTSVSADGQSVSYQQASSSSSGEGGVAGAAPALQALRRWRRKAVYQRRRYPTPAWPYRWV